MQRPIILTKALALMYSFVFLAIIALSPNAQADDENMTEAEFLEHINNLTGGSNPSTTAALNLIARLEQQAPRFSGSTQRKLAIPKCWFTFASNMSQVPEFTHQQLDIARQTGDQELSAHMLLCQGFYYFYQGQPKQSLQNYQQALNIGLNLPNQRIKAEALAARGEVHSYLGDLAMGLEDLLQAQAIYDEIDLPFAGAYNLSVIANTYRRMGAYQDAIAHYDILYQMYTDTEDRHTFQGFRLEQSFIYQELKDFDRALELALGAYNFYKRHQENNNIANAATYLASIYNDKGDYQTAITYLQEANALSTHPNQDPQLNQLYLGQALFGLNQPHQAIEALEKAEASFIREGNRRYLMSLYQLRSEIYHSLKQWQAAFIDQKHYSDIFAELTDKQNEQHSARLRIEFDLQRANDENQYLKQQQELTDAKLEALAKASRWQIMTMLLGSLLFFIVLAAGVRFFLHAKRMHKLALTDALTGLPNRRHIEEAGLQMVAMSRQTQFPCCLLVLDIDHFKAINDSFGHECGDKVLKRLSKESQAAVRTQDLIGRTGGEEFVVLLPATDQQQAQVIAERLRVSIEQIDFSDIASPLNVTTSIGVAELRDETLEKLTTRADHALYVAKANGRNRVELA